MEFDPPRVSTRDEREDVGTWRANAKACALSDIRSHMIDRNCMDLFMMEAALTLQTSAARKARQANDVVALLEVQDPGSHVPPRLSASDEADMAAGRMESLGRHVGANLTEILLRDKPRLPDTLDRVKFVCKELWSVVWNKQIDNLRTNHRGVFVLQDQAFRALLAIGQPDAAHVYVSMQLSFASGLLLGALERLGIPCSVQADAEYPPVCSFHVRLMSI